MTVKFVVSSTQRAKRVAKDLKIELEAQGLDLPWTKCLEAVSRIYGFDNWQALLSSSGAEASIDDAASPDDVVAARQAQAAAAITQLGVSSTLAVQIVDRIRPTSRSKLVSAPPTDSTLGLQLQLIHAKIAGGRWDDAARLAWDALKDAPSHQRRPFMDVLKRSVDECAEGILLAARAYAAYVDRMVVDNAIANCVRGVHTLTTKYRGQPAHVMAQLHELEGDLNIGCYGKGRDLNRAIHCYDDAVSCYPLPSAQWKLAATTFSLNPDQPVDLVETLVISAAQAGHAGALVSLAALEKNRRSKAFSSLGLSGAVGVVSDDVVAASQAYVPFPAALAKIVPVGPDFWVKRILPKLGWPALEKTADYGYRPSYLGSCLAHDGRRVHVHYLHRTIGEAGEDTPGFPNDERDDDVVVSIFGGERPVDFTHGVTVGLIERGVDAAATPLILVDGGPLATIEERGWTDRSLGSVMDFALQEGVDELLYELGADFVLSEGAAPSRSPGGAPPPSSAADEDMEIARIIEQRRIELGMGHKWLAAQSGLSEPDLLLIVNGVREPHKSEWDGLAGALSMSVDEMMGLEPQSRAFA